MAKFGPPSESEVPQIRNTSLKEINLGFFRTLVIRMGNRGCGAAEVVAFTKNPNSNTFQMKEEDIDPNSPLLNIFEEIKKHTTLDERKTVLLEFES